MNWTAIIPFNFGGECKTRLADVLDPPERRDLALSMARHVLSVVREVPGVGQIYLLSPEPPPLEAAQWIADLSRGLNLELASAIGIVAAGPTLIIHADLPVVAARDIAQLLEAAETSGVAIASDWRAEGTNALAAADAADLKLYFGPGSFAKHVAAMPHCVKLLNEAISLDLDTVADLDELRRRNYGAQMDKLLSPARYGGKAV